MCKIPIWRKDGEKIAFLGGRFSRFRSSTGRNPWTQTEQSSSFFRSHGGARKRLFSLHQWLGKSFFRKKVARGHHFWPGTGFPAYRSLTSITHASNKTAVSSPRKIGQGGTAAHIAYQYKNVLFAERGVGGTALFGHEKGGFPHILLIPDIGPGRHRCRAAGNRPSPHGLHRFWFPLRPCAGVQPPGADACPPACRPHPWPRPPE